MSLELIETPPKAKYWQERFSQLGQTAHITTAWVRGSANYPIDYVTAWLNNQILHGTQHMVSHFEIMTDRPREVESHIRSRGLLEDVEVRITDVGQVLRDWQVQGYWVKMLLYSPERKGRTIWIDLDTVTLRPLEGILTHAAAAELVMHHDWIEYGGKYASGVMQVRPENSEILQRIWSYWISRPGFFAKRCSTGDQGFVTGCLRELQLRPAVFPDGWVGSWKWREGTEACMQMRSRGSLKHDTGSVDRSIVMCFHGKPNPHEQLTNRTVKEFWRP